MEQAAVDLRQEAKKPFLDIQEEFQGSIVYLDPPAAEVVQWTFGGIDFFLSLGAEFVTLLPSPSSCTSSSSSETSDDTGGTELLRGRFASTRALIFLSSYLPEYRDSLKGVLAEGAFTECVVYSGLPESAHSHYPELGGGLFNSYIRMMKDWMKRKQTSKLISPVAVVIPFPLLYSPFTLNTFFLPPCHDIFPAVRPVMNSAESHTSPMEQLPKSFQLSVKRLANVLSQTMKQWGFKEDVYPIGFTAKLLADELSKISEQTAGSSSPRGDNPVSLILVDRTVDLVAPLRHSTNLMDRIKNVLRSPLASNDVQIEMLPYISQSPIYIDKGIFPHGSLVPPEDDKISNSILKALVVKSQKDALISLRKKLTKVISEEGFSVQSKSSGTAVTPARLLALLRPFQNDETAFYRHMHLMQYAAGVISAIQQSESTSWDELMGVEKLIIHTAKDPSETGSVRQLNELLSVGKFSAAKIMGLAVMAYSMAGQPFSHDDESAFQEALIENLINFPQDSLDWLGDDNVAGMLRQHYQESSDANAGDSEEQQLLKKQIRMGLEDVIASCLERLRFFAEVRSALKLREYAHVVGKGAGGTAYTSILGRVARDSVGRGEENLHDLEKHTSAAALPDLLGMASSLGLGRFGFGLSKVKSKPKPSDNKVIIIFVIGGITCAEIQEIHQNVAEAVDDGYQVLVGSTGLCTGGLMLAHLFAANAP